jgi:predicted Zn-dependent protease
MQTGFVTGFAADVELRADENAARIAHAAGFGPDAGSEMLAQLEKTEGERKMKRELIMSNLIGMEPGLQKRKAAMQKVVNELKQKSAE